MNLNAGQLLQGRYRLDVPMRQGLYGQVWRAFDQRLNDRPVAIKCMLSSQTREAQTFDREAQLLSGLIHPNVIYILDYFVENDEPFLVREWIEGRPLSMLVESCLPSLEQVSAWADQLGSALNYMHTRPSPILLLDLTPLNIVVDEFGLLHLTEFGLSKFKVEPTEDILRGVHTPRFSPPELSRGDEPDEFADQYMMGAVLWYLLTGQVPTSPTMAPGDVRPEVPPSLDRAILKMMAAQKTGRYPSVQDARGVLSLVFTERPGTDFEWVKAGKPADLRMVDGRLPLLPATYDGRPARVLWINEEPYDTPQEPASTAQRLLKLVAGLPSLYGVHWPMDVVRRVASHGCGMGSLMPPPAYHPLLRDTEPTATFDKLARAGQELLDILEQLTPLRSRGVEVTARNVLVEPHHGTIMILPDVYPPELQDAEADPHLVESLLFSLFFGREARWFASYVDGNPRRWRRAPSLLREALEAVLGPEGTPARTPEYARLLQQIMDCSYLCPHCSEEVFYQSGEEACRSCAGILRTPRLLQFASASIVIKPGSRVYPHHLQADLPCVLTQPLAVVSHHNHHLTAENTSSFVWTVRDRDGGVANISPNHRVALEEGRCIEFNLPAVETAKASGEVV